MVAKKRNFTYKRALLRNIVIFALKSHDHEKKKRFNYLDGSYCFVAVVVRFKQVVASNA